MRKKQFIKKFLLLLFCLLITLQSVPLLAFAAVGETVKVSDNGFNDLIVKLSNGNTEYGWRSKVIQETGQTAYCVQQGVPLNQGNNGGYTAKEVTKQEYYRMSLADYFGRIKCAGNSLKNEFMTQLYIWEVQGITVRSIQSYGSWEADVTMAEYKAWRNEVIPKIDAFFKKPSFSGQKLKLKVGQSVTLTDTTGSFQYYRDIPVVNRSNSKLKKNGNDLTITATSNSSTGAIQFMFNLDISFQRPVYYYENPQTQDIITTGARDPAFFVLNIEVEKNGKAQIVKTSEDGDVANKEFTVTGGGQTHTGKTDTSGKLPFELLSTNDSGKKIVYTATEVNVPTRYAQPASQTFTVEPNKTTTITFNNKLKRADVKLVKVSEDGDVANKEFTVTGGGESHNGKTDNSGSLVFKGLRPYDSNNNPIVYTATEVNTPARYTQPASQTFTLEYGKTTTITFDNKLKRGNFKLVKQSEDGDVANKKFKVTGGGQSFETVTGTDGDINLKGMRTHGTNNAPIVYTATEVNVATRYVQPKSQTFTLEPNKTTTITFNNKLKRADVKLVKVSEDGDVANKEFRVTGGGESFVKRTGNDGYIDMKGLRMYDSNDKLIVYTATETSTPSKYVQPASQTFTLEYGKTTTITFKNILKKWQLMVTKKDAETDMAQGDGTLAGAKYGLYKGDTLIDTYVTDSNYQFTTKVYLCDSDDYTLQEIEPSYGYLLDPTVYQVGVSAGSTTIEMNPTKKTVTEQVIKGRVQLHKFLQDPGDETHSGLRTPEPEAIFELYLTSSKSYADSKESERDLLTTNEDGMAVSKDLPKGWYTVHQVQGKPSYTFAPDFEVYVSEQDKTYLYYVGNAGIYSDVKIIKKDFDTEEVIPLAGTGFKIQNPVTGEFISQTLKYPSNQQIDEFYTNAEGYLVLPEQLLAGEYLLYEIQAPNGYVIDTEPTPFTVTGGEEIVEVVKTNKVQKGRIIIEKTGEVLSSIIESNGIYQPVYAEQPLDGAEIELTAAEDIYTPDGTLRYEKGQVINTLVTGEDGKASFEDLYLGKFLYTEKSAPNGYVIDTEPHEIELVYAGQTVEITESTGSIYNERQKISISFVKQLEQDEFFGVGSNGEIQDVQFGLYAAEEITAQDETVIPKDGLLETVTMQEDGKQTFTVDLPPGEYYLQEIATNSHYVLSDTKYPVKFEYQGQDTALVELTANDGKPIDNKLIRGSVELKKVDKENPEILLSGAEFEIYQDSDQNGDLDKTDIKIGNMEEESGMYKLSQLVYGGYFLRESKAPENYLLNDNIYYFEIKEDGQTVTIENQKDVGFVNQHVPEISTLAVNAEDDTKILEPLERVTLKDTVSSKHLIIGADYEYKSHLVDLSTKEPLLIDGQEVTAFIPFTADKAESDIDVLFTFNGADLAGKDVVLVGTLYQDGKEMAVHNDLENKNQTVSFSTPKIKTKSTVNGKKTLIITSDTVTVKDTISFEDLIVGKEHHVKGLLMDKSTKSPFLVDGKPIISEKTFVPEKSTGEVEVEFTVSTEKIDTLTDLVVFETLYRDDMVLAKHEDIEDKEQTITLIPPSPLPPTGDTSNILVQLLLLAFSIAGAVMLVILGKKKKS